MSGRGEAIGDPTVALVVLGVIVAVALLVSWWRR
jgi:hypothetical protein